MAEHKISELGGIIAVLFSIGMGILIGTGSHDGRVGIGIVFVSLGVIYGITRLWWYLDEHS